MMGGWYKIGAAFVKWMTPAQALQTQPDTFGCAMNLDRLTHIL
jgi:hypothetical protein